VSEFDKRLPTRLKTTLIIETLQEITKQAKLKFSSLEPAPIKKHELKETKDVFVELPVKIKLKCSYYDLVDFLEKIETAKQLMKVADLSIRDDPTNDWEHSIEFSISAFSRGESGD
jgi:Tfp pilus assembly protein PilO